MDIYLVDLNPVLVAAWRQHTTDGVHTIDCADIFKYPADVIVSPANSFGKMDGGIDQIYTNRFGLYPQEYLTDHIMINGEILVGSAVLVPIEDEDFPYMISAPTMRVPMILPADTINPYLATKAALVCAQENGFDSIVFPGMGTGVGEVSSVKCAKQMAQAIHDYDEKEDLDWRAILDKHTLLKTM